MTVPPLRRALKARAPHRAVEQRLWAAGHSVVIGVDEVGRGAWAGPISVGAVIIPKDRRIYKIRDSKMLTENEREAIFDRVANWCVDWHVGHASHEECDRLGMRDAQRLAGARAIDGLDLEIDQVLIDGDWDFIARGDVTTIIRGDVTSLTIATASILAKVTRDRLMKDESIHFPAYNFESNKGYPTPQHMAALQAWGPTTIHRRTWRFMDALPWSRLPHPHHLRP